MKWNKRRSGVVKVGCEPVGPGFEVTTSSWERKLGPGGSVWNYVPADGFSFMLESFSVFVFYARWISPGVRFLYAGLLVINVRTKSSGRESLRLSGFTWLSLNRLDLQLCCLLVSSRVKLECLFWEHFPSRFLLVLNPHPAPSCSSRLSHGTPRCCEIGSLCVKRAYMSEPAWGSAWKCSITSLRMGLYQTCLLLLVFFHYVYHQHFTL